MFTRKPKAEENLTGFSPPPLGATPAMTKPPLTPRPSSEDTSKSASEAHEEGLVVIGKGTTVDGTIGHCRKLDVHGILQGEVVADILIVRDGGGIKGNVQTDRATIHGVIEGTLVVHEHLQLESTAHVSGEVSYRTLSIVTGARLEGNCVCSEATVEEVQEPGPFPTVIPISNTRNGGAYVPMSEPSATPSHAPQPIGSDYHRMN